MVPQTMPLYMGRSILMEAKMIFPVESQSDVRSKPALPLTTTLGPVQIAVTDRDKALAIWRDVVGLELISEAGNELRLGAGGKVLIVLETGAVRPVVQRTTGLYHVAIHVPGRVDMAQFAVRALQRGVRIAPTDHLVSEAIYLWDLDGNGIEITFETPWRGTLGDPESGSYATTSDGKPHSGREPIDMDDLLGELGENPTIAARMPEGTRIGHVHVHVNDLHQAMAFYRDGIGFGGLFIIKSFGMGDVGLDYTPHAVAFNIWAGPNATQAPAGSAGLRWFTIVVPDAQTLDDVRARLAAHSFRFDETSGGIDVRDPSGNLVKVVVK
ncbi:MAG: VOC family protein [Devosia sp.]|uniref:VOC family protein n=1 Tax=Devosia sp. TaxID=1871048 RepID=UPI001A415121|nr:VOC family protein [Devosia sp.]MBL8597575.1 VOC family protein [Devosia sp.]